MAITTSPLVKIYTLQEFWDLSEPVDRSKLELIKGVLYMTPPPDFPHNEAAADLNEALRAEIKRCGYKGKVYVPRAAIWVDDDTHLEPDLMYISDELKGELRPGHRTRADIVVEILSSRTALYDRTTKSDTYRAMGVREMWLVDLESKEIEVRSFEMNKTSIYKTDEALCSGGLPAIRIPVGALFT